MEYIKQMLNKINPEINFEVRKMKRQLKLTGKALHCPQKVELFFIFPLLCFILVSLHRIPELSSDFIADQVIKD